ncbi:class I SAM-dependent methyltransferase [Castellaniella sp.]|uniref:class I SAM-dependent methyltransferase n=1 Tax=Castellaniella sp. TaxID=1955812 RepID=UPI002AFE5125|nr:class I SAM-dependent methyltransferase [Castellaniella sp.]
MSKKELSHLEKISEHSLYAAGVNTASILYSFQSDRRHLRGVNILEMGPAEGVMTERLATLGLKMTLVEGSARFCEDLADGFPDATIEHTLFEEFDPSDRFDNIVLGHVLEHVQDPVDILARARRWLTPGGRIFGAVPNARSLRPRGCCHDGHSAD